jgi:flavin reductase (DIM6/NTAB) family NADH-FMN oxidoreductase RutF
MDDRTTQPSLREVMSRYPTGVTIVASRDEDETPYGITVNSFTSVSLDPPLVLVCVGHRSTWHDRLVSADGFAVSVLAFGQDAIAARFAREPSAGRFDEVAWSPSPSGDPVVDGAVAWLDCTRFGVLDGGDHSILLARVEASGASDRPALVFHRGRLTSTAG